LTDASSNNFPPVNLLNQDGELLGFGRDLSDAVGRAVGVEIRHLHSPHWNQVLQWLDSGEADLIHDAGYTKERDVFLDYSEPILEMPEMIFVRPDQFDIADLESLKGKKVACVDNHISHLYLKTFPEINCFIVKTPAEGLYDLVSKNVDAFVYPEQIVIYLAQQLRLHDKIKTTGAPLRILTWSMVVKEGNDELLALLNRGIETVKNSGEYDQIYNKWWGKRLLSGYTKNEVKIFVVIAVLLTIAVVAALGLIFYNYKLKSGKRTLEREIKNREEAEKEIKKQNYYLEKAQELGKIGTWELDLINNILVWTDENCRIFGVPEGSVVNYEIFLNKVHPHDREYVDLEWKAGIEGKPYDIEHRLLLDGEVKWVREKADLEFDYNGKAVRAIGFTQDISNRKNVEEALKTNEKRYKKAQEMGRVGNWEYDIGREIFWGSEQAKRIYGYDPKSDSFSTDDVENCIPDRERVHQALIDLIEKDKPYDLEFEIHPISGPKRRVIKSIAELVKNDSGVPTKVIGVIQDITQRIEAEKQVHEAKERFQKVFNSQLDAIFILNSEKPARIVEINKAVSTLFRFSKDEILGQSIDLLHVNESYLTEFQNALFPAVKKQGYLKNFEFSMKRKNGQIFPTEHTVLELKNKAGQRTGWVSIIRDLTERQKFEAQIKQAQKMESIGCLAGGIAHDFNNILFPIIGMSELVMEDLPKDSKEYENIREIFKAGKRAQDLVSQILAFSRQSSEQVRMPVRFQKVLKEVLKLCRSTIPTNIEIEQNIQQDCGSIWANATQLHQIGMNLVTNAYHAVQDQNGKIVIELKETVIENEDMNSISLGTGKYVLLSVTDNGTGMTDEIKNHIFDPYFTTKEKGKGTGLGLSVVYGIVKDFAGDIKVESEPGVGTTFNVYLPLIEKLTDTAPDTINPKTPTGDEHILLVDDEAPIARLVQLTLERLGYTVTTRVSSIKALETFKNTPDKFDMIISDMSMPNMTGDELATEIKSIRPEIPIIVCTGFSDRIKNKNPEEISVNCILMKPVVKFDLAQMVRKELDKAQNP